MGVALVQLLVPLLSLATDPLARYRAEAPHCPPQAQHCFGVFAHVTVVEGDPVAPPAWVAAQLSEANRLFAPLGVGFELDDVKSNDARWADVSTRLQRDQLGRRPRKAGVVHVFVVGRLEDVDVAGEEIRGVHWRDRADTNERWIILSAIGSHRVLAHELGHFFGLPHSSHRASIMNKKPREVPPPEKRGFPPAELDRMRGHLRRMLGDKTLRDRVGS